VRQDKRKREEGIKKKKENENRNNNNNKRKPGRLSVIAKAELLTTVIILITPLRT
jgi:hypothetical protein